MGLFVLDMGTTRQQSIRALKANIDLWLYEAERGQDLDYLLGFMETCLSNAKERPFAKAADQKDTAS